MISSSSLAIYVVKEELWLIYTSVDYILFQVYCLSFSLLILISSYFTTFSCCLRSMYFGSFQRNSNFLSLSCIHHCTSLGHFFCQFWILVQICHPFPYRLHKIMNIIDCFPVYVIKELFKADTMITCVVVLLFLHRIILVCWKLYFGLITTRSLFPKRQYYMSLIASSWFVV